MHDVGGSFLGQFGRRTVGVISPGPDPSIPRVHDAQRTDAEPEDPVAGLHHPEHVTWAMLDVAGQVSAEADTDRRAEVGPAFERQTDRLCDARAGTVSAYEVGTADVVLDAGQPISDPRGHPLVVLFDPDQLSVEAHVSTAQHSLADHDRLEHLLRKLRDGARAGQVVLKLQARARGPRLEPP